ncbi:MAG: adenylate/guanylate cyclase domain-containing protein, partial [Saprospiraceae bacterium]|nr:adenylate/guanylate cyclase domain-containing protein [Saprospiraceae bacterium]
HWTDERAITPDTSVVTAEARITIPLSNRTLIFEPVRLSAVYRLQGGVHRLVHWHTSFPDNSESDEIFPGAMEPRQYEDITVVFTDLVGFTKVAAKVPPETLVAELGALFVRFDTLSKMYGLDKIKTIGDSYMAVSGLCYEHENAALQAIHWARAALAYLAERNQRSRVKWDLRIGMHTGPVIGGVLGTDKLSFDLWGDTVNVAKRMESNSAPNRINISEDTYRLVQEHIPAIHRGCCTVKGKREVEMYYVA